MIVHIILKVEKTLISYIGDYTIYRYMVNVVPSELYIVIYIYKVLGKIRFFTLDK